MKADFFDQSFFVTGWEIVCKNGKEIISLYTINKYLMKLKRKFDK